MAEQGRNAVRTERRHLDRELSWLAFNERVLQEAADPTVPLLERLMFLAIFSSNLDEFFRVRVASIRSLLRLKKKKLQQVDIKPQKLLRDIHQRVTVQQRRFGEIFSREILPRLAEEGIIIHQAGDVPQGGEAFAVNHFESVLAPHVNPVILGSEADLFLRNSALYLVCLLWPRHDGALVVAGKPEYGIVEIPSSVPRFAVVESEDPGDHVMFIDDILRINLAGLFPDHDVDEAYAIKLTRDAELYLEDEFSGDLVEAIKKSLAKRETGLPTRFLYDQRMPYPMVKALSHHFDLDDDDIVAGGYYHNFSDFFQFPAFHRPHLKNVELPPLPHPVLSDSEDLFAAIRLGDEIVHFPYQTFEPVNEFFRQAATDAAVEEIWITLYRAGTRSAIIESLIEAAHNGKSVHVFVEVKARFDEESNIEWARRLEEAGAVVMYSERDLKVHAKIALVVRREGDVRQRYAYMSTGNFNEKTARIYADHGLFTADERLTSDAAGVFAVLADSGDKTKFAHLLVAPDQMRKKFYGLIDREIKVARSGCDASITAKMNSLEDAGMVDRLTTAAEAGVGIRLIVRGICTLDTGTAGAEDRLEAVSIVDRFLEHARVYRFLNNGDISLYLASADWMKRNLSRRIEVAFPLYDTRVRQQIEDILEIQLADNTHARVIDSMQRNEYNRRGGEPRRAQMEIYRYCETLCS